MTIDANTTVRDLLAVHRETVSILLSHGMCADCDAAPPAVPLARFATKHCDGNLDGLIEKLTRAIGSAPV